VRDAMVRTCKAHQVCCRVLSMYACMCWFMYACFVCVCVCVYGYVYIYIIFSIMCCCS
jgi:hypothetical protein